MDLGRRGQIQDASVGTGRQGLKDTLPRSTALETMDFGREGGEIQDALVGIGREGSKDKTP